MRRSAWPILLLVLAGCGSSQKVETNPNLQTEAPYVAAPADPWVLSTLDPRATEPVWLSNGLIGIRIGRNGTGYGPDGKLLPFYTADEYDVEGEEKIRTLPNPLTVLVDEASNPLFASDDPPRKVDDYRQHLDMRTGILLTGWKENISGGTADVLCETAIHPTKRIIAQKWTLRADRDADFGVGLSGDSVPVLTEKEWQKDDLTVTMMPIGSGMKWKVRRRQLTEAVPYRILTKKGEPHVVELIWSFGRSPNTAQMLFARTGMWAEHPAGYFDPPIPPTYEDVANASLNTWLLQRWKTDIEIDGPVEDQQAVRSMMFYLQAAMHPEAPISVPPMALSSAQYGGHAFWDADVWVFPALALINPELARTIPEYRVRMADQARRNYRDWLAAGRPTAKGKVEEPSPRGRGEGEGDTNRQFHIPADGLMYPWESSVTGRETVPGPSKWQHHITGSVLWGLDQASALGLASPETVNRIGREAAAFYLARSEGSLGAREIRSTMSPDEHHIGDNDLYTNLLAEWVDRRFLPELSRTVRYKRPRDDKSLLTYDNDEGKVYKQAAAVLAIYPLEDTEAEKQARALMERFAGKVTPNGPAMSDSVHATIWARLGESDKAYEAWKKSWGDFTQHPLLLFSEKRRKPVTYFVTGAGGSLQSVIYGFLGFRIDSSTDRTAKWSTKLSGERWLNVQPHLPKAWRSVRFKNFQVLGRSYTLTATPTTTQVTPGE